MVVTRSALDREPVVPEELTDDMFELRACHRVDTGEQLEWQDGHVAGASAARPAT